MAELDDRYRSLFLIGRGGMGTVEVALERSPAGFERIVALKRMLPETSRDERHKAMFLREARLAARLSHPNVVHAFAFGELHGELYLAMEYVEGEPLARLLAAAQAKEGGLDPTITAHILAEVCDGLHAAHELKDDHGQPLRVVHRDVSPHNVMVSYEGHVKLLDFGVAKFDSGDARTRTGEVKGKMGYMSPEQALGEPLDRRSDLFSIGALLYECATGAKMWGDGTDLDIMRRLALEEPPTLDGHPNAPPALVDLHRRLVAREPSARPATAKSVADELRVFLGTSSARADARIVKGLMRRLFAVEAENQRASLSRALEAAAPANIDELRRSIEPPNAAPLGEMRAASPSSSSNLAVSTAVPSRSRRGVVVVAGVAAVVAIAAVATSAVTRTERAASAASAASTASTAAATAIPSAPLTLTPTSPSPSPPPPPSTPTSPSPATPPTPTPTTPGRPALRPFRPPTKPVAPPPHVDPTPF